MLITCWSPKGGTGTSTTVAVMAAAALRRRRPVRVLDATGDQAALFAVAPTGPGLHDWLAGGADAPLDAIDRLALTVAPRAVLVHAGLRPEAPSAAAAGVALARHLRSDATITLADLGAAGDPALAALAEHADVSLVVARACFLALARITADERTAAATGLVVLRERGRTLRAHDVEAVTGRPVVLDTPLRPSIARLADAGTLLHAAGDALLAPWQRLLARLTHDRRAGAPAAAGRRRG